MQLKILLILSIACLLNNCAHRTPKDVAPKVSVYISTPTAKGLFGYNEINKVTNFVRYENSDKFTCFTPDDLQILLRQCAQPGGL